ncbi:MAG: hypothetical protein HYR96_00895 [Deltaproteobacteria bacterium]|nr:hypothetical protein [Deltaproteobacteria bacterium]MBI3296075.1 hypothetical protein [Deltaproteobacteria bacterium]
MNRSMTRLTFVLALILGLAGSLRADEFYRTFYNEDLESGPYLKMKQWEGLNREERKARAEEAYGSKLIYLPYDNDHKPHTDEIVHLDQDDGIRRWFLLSSWDDQPWVKTTPGMDLEANFETLEKSLLTRLQVKFPNIRSLADKFDEYSFVTTFFPEMAPPKMQVAIDFVRGSETKDELAIIEAKVTTTMKAKDLTDTDLKSDLTTLELIRTRINKNLGFSILKNRGLNHSEGRLPKSKKEWVALYANYVASGEKETIDRFLKSDKGGFAEELLEMKYPEGYALETLLRQPQKIIAQKMVDLQREIRLHIVRGKIMKGGSFLRFYKLGDYLREDELELIEKTVEEKILAKLTPAERDSFYASPDIYLTKEPVTDGYPSRRVLIGDFNDDIDSGYLEPTEDMITTNLLAWEFRGIESKPSYLALLDDFRALPIEHDQKLPMFRAFMKRSAPFMEGDVFSAYFDRVGENYLSLIAQTQDDKQRQREYTLALRHLLTYETEGVKMLHLTKQSQKDEFLFKYQHALVKFIIEFQDKYPGVRAPIALMRELHNRLKAMSAEVDVVLTGSEKGGPESRIVATMRAEALSKTELRELRADIKRHLTKKKKSVRKLGTRMVKE